jgi:hypothetical protein
MYLSTASVQVGSPPANRLATARNTGVPTDRPVLPCTHKTHENRESDGLWIAREVRVWATPFRTLQDQDFDECILTTWFL